VTELACFLVGIVHGLVGWFYSDSSEMPREWRWLYIYFWPIIGLWCLCFAPDKTTEVPS
jgi:hypothetical protein